MYKIIGVFTSVIDASGKRFLKNNVSQAANFDP